MMAPGSAGLNHNTNCKKFRTEENPYLFAYIDEKWVLAPGRTTDLFNMKDTPLDENFPIHFRRVMLTDEQFILTIGGTIG